MSLDQLRLGVKEQLLIFSVSCLSPRRVKKLWTSVSKLAIVLIWNIQSPHEDNRPVTPVKCTKSAHRRTGTIYDSCRFDIGHFHVEPTDKCAYCSAHSNLFLMLHVIHKLKIARNAGGTHYLQLYCKNKHSDLYFLSVSSFLHLVCLFWNHVFTCISARLNSEVSSTRLSSVMYWCFVNCFSMVSPWCCENNGCFFFVAVFFASCSEDMCSVVGYLWKRARNRTARGGIWF